MPGSGSLSGTFQYFYPGGRGTPIGPQNRVTLVDASTQEVAEIDKAGYLVTINNSHHKTHEGKLFVISDDDSSIADGTNKYWLIRTGASGSDGILTHFSYHIDVDNKCAVSFWEGPTLSASDSIEVSGTALTPQCTNRATPGTTFVEGFKDPSILASGTLLEVHHVGSSGFGVSTGGAAAADVTAVEWILSSETDYLLSVYAEGAATHASLIASFYSSSAGS